MKYIKYPKEKEQLEDFLNKTHEKEQKYIHYNYSEKLIIGGIIPYSANREAAPEAIHLFEIIKKAEKNYDVVVIICPDYSASPYDISLCKVKEWNSTFGAIEVDVDFQEKLAFPYNRKSKVNDEIRVILDLLKYYLKDGFKVVPVFFKSQKYDDSTIIAKSIHKAQEGTNKNILVLAASDFSHYTEPDMGIKLDDIVLKQVNNFDSKNLVKEVEKYSIDISGLGPIMAILGYSKLYHYNPKATILRKGNSHDKVEVVDYITLLFYGE